MSTASERNKSLYLKYVELLNRQQIDKLPEVVDVEKYREDCVGFTSGWVSYPEAIQSVQRVYVAIPDVHIQVDELIAEDDLVYARATVTGTNTGSLFGVPPTRKAYSVNMFDYVKIADGKIVERVQQSDNLGQMKQLYGDVLKWTGVGLAGLLVGFSAVWLARR